MTKIPVFFDKDRNIGWLSLLSSFIIYFYYFHHILLNPNTILSSIDGDSLKNYYTYIYHIKNDADVLNFSGLNFPFGEHIVYTDCQPLLTFILRALPFTHNYLIGILHYLIFFSFIITPLILYKVFRMFDISKFSSFFISLAVALLSPQIWRVDGHFALTYECVIPFTILLLLQFFNQRNNGAVIRLSLVNSLLFFIHPYLGFGVSVFSLFAILMYDIASFDKKQILKNSVHLFIISLLPIILFKLFMSITDTHINRSEQPYGIDIEIASVQSILIPNFGPFQEFLKHVISDTPGQFEGIAYIGLFLILMSSLCVFIFPILIKHALLNKKLVVLFLSACLLLIFSFGLHNSLLQSLGIQIKQLNQFRALGRFAWYFYYMLPIFVLPSVFFFFNKYLDLKKSRLSFGIVAFVFFCVNLLEANSLLIINSQNFWHSRNIFNVTCLNDSEKKLIQEIKEHKPQAIVPIPIYHIGSEIYDRVGSTFGILPSIFYAYHTNTPILSTMLSRTSITETENLIEALNSYKKNREINKFLTNQPFLIIKLNDFILPDEERLIEQVNFFTPNDTVSFGFISNDKFMARKLDKNVYTVQKDSIQKADSNNIIFVPFDNRRPFTEGNILNYETLMVVDSNQLQSGSYIVSLHYHYSKKTFKEVFCNLIVTKTHGEKYDWQYNFPIRVFSGFYPGFAVFEYKIEMAKENKYEFILKGNVDQTYKISNFMIRPNHKSVIVLSQKNDTLFNNFPAN